MSRKSLRSEERRRPCAVDDLQVPALLLGTDLPRKQQRGEAQHARKRRPQLVGDDAHELGLQALALPKLLVLRLELGTAPFQLLGHLVERDLELADLPGPRALLVEPRGEISAGQASCRLCNAANGASRRAREVDAEQDDEQRRGDQAGDCQADGTIGLPVSRSCTGRRKRILGGEETRELLANLVGSPLTLLSGDEVSSGGRIEARDVEQIDRVVLFVLPDRGRQVPGSSALFRIRRREAFKLSKPARVELLPRLSIRLQKSILPCEDVATHTRLEIEDELLEPERRRCYVLRVGFSTRRVVEPGDGIDQNGEDTRDQSCKDRAGDDHAERKREGLRPVSERAHLKPRRVPR